MSVRSLYNFRESRFTTLSHELRVFIFGADVTPWLKGDLSVTYGNRDSFNSCVFELANPKRLWQITRDNLSGIWREAVGEYSEREKLNTFRWKNSPDINPSFNLKVDTQVLGQKDKRSDGAALMPGAKKLVPPPEGTERRYRLAVNDCIFSRLDPMRIFMRNPLSSTSDEWVEVFCGFVQDHPITTNYMTGESTLRINGICIRQTLTKMRVQMNRLNGVPDSQPLFEDGFFADFKKPSMAKHPFATTTLEQTIKELILGNATPKPGDVAKAVGGIGEFKMGNIVCYNPGAPGTTLERWHLMTLFGVNKVPYPTSADDDLWLTQFEMNNLGRATIYLPEAFAQGPGGRFLHFLLPYEGTGAGALTGSTLDNSPPRAIEWTTRWEIIKEFASKLDFQVTTSPSGDILVEFPLYSFTPHVFTTQGGIDLGAAEYISSPAVRAAASKANEASTAKVDDDINKGAIPYGLGSLLTFELHQMEDTLNDEAEDFPTILQVDGGMAVQPTQMTEGEDWATNLRAFVYSPVLVARFGVVTEQMSIPFAGQKSADQSGGLDSPIAKRLSKLALIEYMKRMADASTWDGSVVYRPFLFPNRPVWLKRSARMGLLTSVTNRWSIGKSASTNFSMHMLMAERYNPDTDTTVYRLPTGASNTPISYKEVWADSPNGEKGFSSSGVRVQVGTKATAKDSSSTAGAPGSDKPAPSSPATWSASVKSAKGGDMVFKPLVNIIDGAIELAKKRGFKPIKVTSTYRPPEQQERMKLHPAENGVARKKNGDFVQVGEPWKSAHQYGLAIDISIEGGSYADYQEFATICNQVAADQLKGKPSNKILWGGNAYNNDYVHYEWNAPGGKTGAQANEYRTAKGYSTSNTSGVVPQSAYLADVWAHFTALEGGTSETIAGKTPSVPPAAEDTTAGRAKKSGTTAAKVEPCNPMRLTANDTKLAEAEALANQIASVMRS